MKLREYGNPKESQWHQPTLSDCVGILESLCEREVEHMENCGSKTHGDGPLAVRLDLIEKARELIEVAESGNLRIMRQEWRKVCKL